MDEQELRLECLKMAVEFGSARTVNDPISLANKYMDWIKKSADKPKAQRRKPVSKAG